MVFRRAELYLSGLLVLVALLFALVVFTDYSPQQITGLSFGTTAVLSSCGNINESSTLSAAVDAGGINICFNVTADNVILDCEGNAIFNAGTAIRLGNSTGSDPGKQNITIKNCLIENVSTTGIQIVEGTNDSLFFNNTFRNITDAITINNSRAFTIANNLIENLRQITTANAVEIIGDALNMTFENNTVRNHRLATVFDAGDTGDDVSGIVFRNNLFDNTTGLELRGNLMLLENNNFTNLNTTIGVDLSVTTGFFQNSTFLNNLVANISSGTGVRCKGSDGSVIGGNVLINTSTGFDCQESDNVVWENNTVRDAQLAFLHRTSGAQNTNITFRNNTIANTTSPGLNLTFLNSIVANNLIENNTGAGMVVGVGPSGVLFNVNVTIANNTIRNNTGVGIDLSGFNITVENNVILDNTGFGIDVGRVKKTIGLPISPFNITIKNNTIQLNDVGIFVRSEAGRRRRNLSLEANNLSNNARGSIIIESLVQTFATSVFNISVANSVFPPNATFVFQSWQSVGINTTLTFLNTTSVTSLANLGEIIDINNTAVRVNLSVAPGFNASARLVIAGNALNKPGILFDPEDDGTAQACTSTRCFDAQLVSGEARFTVTQWSTYILNETKPLNTIPVSSVANTTFIGGTNFTNQTTGDGAGFSIATCDINNDNNTDFVIGAPFYAAGNQSAVVGNISDAGKVYVVYGTPELLSNQIINLTKDSNVSVEGENVTGLLGRAVACGDLDNDTLADVVVGGPGGNYTGILFGGVISALGGTDVHVLQAGVSTIINTTGVDDMSLAIGDWNNDGIEDLAIGQPDFNNFAGRVHVIFGRNDWPLVLNVSDNANITITNGPGDHFGFALSGGDINGDGNDDLLVGAPSRNISGVGRVGAVDVFYGPLTQATISAGNANVTFNGEPTIGSANNDNASTGFSVYARGDVNNDSIDDVLIGSPLTRVEDDGLIKQGVGVAYLVFGSSSLSGNVSLSNADVTFFGTFGRTINASDGEKAGFAVFSKNMSTNDQVDDVIIGAPLANERVGVVYVVFSPPSWPRFINLSDANRTITGSTTNALFGFALANASLITTQPAQTNPGTILEAGLLSLVRDVLESLTELGIPGTVYDQDEPPPTTPTAAVTAAPTPTVSGGGGGSLGIFSACRENERGQTVVYSFNRAFTDPKTGISRRWVACDSPLWEEFAESKDPTKTNMYREYLKCCPCVVTPQGLSVRVSATHAPVFGIIPTGIPRPTTISVPCNSPEWYKTVCAKSLIDPASTTLCEQFRQCCC